jgi:hypothetical protein
MKEACGFAKERILSIKKKKMDKCTKYQNNGYFDARLKERNKKKR